MNRRFRQSKGVKISLYSKSPFRSFSRNSELVRVNGRRYSKVTYYDDTQEVDLEALKAANPELEKVVIDVENLGVQPQEEVKTESRFSRFSGSRTQSGRRFDEAEPLRLSDPGQPDPEVEFVEENAPTVQSRGRFSRFSRKSGFSEDAYQPEGGLEDEDYLMDEITGQFSRGRNR